MKKYSFSNFAIGKANQLAYLSIKRTIKELGGEINPLFIHSTSGLGKTHLMRSVMETLEDSEIQWLNGGEITSIPERAGNVLIFEDIHLLKDEERKGMKLFDLVRAYIDNKNQIYMTSLYPPLALGMSAKLMSVIKEGLTVPIFKPNSELTQRVFLMKCKESGFELSPDVFKYLSSLPFSDMRGIETVVKKIALLKEVMSDITIENIKDTVNIEDILGEGKGTGEHEETEFSDFVEDLREGLGEAVLERKDKHTAKEEYVQKLYVWRMKGFNVTRLEKAMQGPLDGIIQAFVSFTSDIQRLIELQKQYGELEEHVTGEECEYFEKELFNPDAVLDLSNALAKIENRKKMKVEYNQFLDSGPTSKNFIILPSNREAYKVLKQASTSEQKVKFPVYICGSNGCGKTHLLMVFAKKMQSENLLKLVSYIPSEFFILKIKNLLDEKARDRYIEKLKLIDTLFLDNIEGLLEHENGRFVLGKIQKLFSPEAKKLIVSSVFPPEELNLEDEAKEVFRKGTIVKIRNIEKDEKVIILTNLSIELGVSLPLEVKEFLSMHLGAKITDIRKNVEKIIRKIVDLGVEMTVENVARCIGIKLELAEESALETHKVKTEVHEKSLQIDFDLRWPYLNERIFEDFDAV